MLQALERLGEGIRRRSETTTARIWLYLHGAKSGEALADVRTYCMFVGYPRSGHSLVGSLLNAHPNVVIAHELDALKYVQRGVSRSELFSLILRRDRQFAQMGRRWTGYDYAVPGGWQGRQERLLVIGDKKGGRSALRLAEDPALLGRLLALVALPVVLIHVVRNPYDNVATMCGRAELSVDEAIRLYFTMCASAERTIAVVGGSSTSEVHYEDFVADPRASLRALWKALGQEASPELLDACASVVRPSPSRTRDRIAWSPAQIAAVESGIDRFPFLRRYAGTLGRDAT